MYFHNHTTAIHVHACKTQKPFHIQVHVLFKVITLQNYFVFLYNQNETTGYVHVESINGFFNIYDSTNTLWSVHIWTCVRDCVGRYLVSQSSSEQGLDTCQTVHTTILSGVSVGIPLHLQPNISVEVHWLCRFHQRASRNVHHLRWVSTRIRYKTTVLRWETVTVVPNWKVSALKIRHIDWSNWTISTVIHHFKLTQVVTNCRINMPYFSHIHVY